MTNGEIRLLNITMRLKRAPQREVRFLRPREDENTTRLDIKAMDDTWSLSRTDARHLGKAADEVFGERALFVPRRGVNNLARRLLNDDD